MASGLHQAHVAVVPDARAVKAEDIAVSPHRVLSTERLHQCEVLVAAGGTVFQSMHGKNAHVAFSLAWIPLEHLQRIQQWTRLDDRLECRWNRSSGEIPEGLDTSHAAVVAANISNDGVACKGGDGQ